jgi:hypothetical protein
MSAINRTTRRRHAISSLGYTHCERIRQAVRIILAARFG